MSPMRVTNNSLFYKDIPYNNQMVSDRLLLLSGFKGGFSFFQERSHAFFLVFCGEP
jgi:hypothetical protein